MPFSDVDLERLYVFGSMLLRKLPTGGEPGDQVELGEDVALRYYRLQKQAEGDITLARGLEGELAGPADAGSRMAEDQQVALSALIEQFNERFSTDFGVGNFVEDVAADLRKNHRVREAATANDRTNFGYVADPAIDKALIDRLDHHRDFVNQLFENPEMLRFVRRWVGNDVYSAFEEDRQSRGGGVG